VPNEQFCTTDLKVRQQFVVYRQEKMVSRMQQLCRDIMILSRISGCLFIEGVTKGDWNKAKVRWCSWYTIYSIMLFIAHLALDAYEAYIVVRELKVALDSVVLLNMLCFTVEVTVNFFISVKNSAQLLHLLRKINRIGAN